MERFLADLDALRVRPQSVPTTSMRMRWKRSWVDAPLLRVGGRAIVTLFLYEAGSTSRARPSWKCEIDPLSTVEHIEQGSPCDVVGVLRPGRAIAVHVGNTRLIASYPISRPLRGPRLGV